MISRLTYISITFLILSFFSLPTATTQEQSYMTETGHVEFDSSVPLHSFTGESDHLVGKITLSDLIVDFYVDLNTLKTGIKKRDNDMLRTLEAKQYPFAEFYGEITSTFNLTDSSPQEVTVEGEFTIHGISRETTITGILQKTSEGLQVKASWTLNMDDFDIEPPGILFYRVSEQIEASISAMLKPT